MSTPTTDTLFKDLALKPTTISALEILNFTNPTPVQKVVIPLLLAHKDVVVEAVTGSGKTLAFLIPAIQLLQSKLQSHHLSKHHVGVIIVSPTRELAKQIYSVLNSLTDIITNISSLLCVGGYDAIIDINKFKLSGAHFIIGTPGRLEELLSTSVFNTKEVELLIMDEADRLLDLGFEKQLNSIINQIPKQRRTGLFSATMSEGVGQLARAGLRNPVRITVGGGRIKESSTKVPDGLQMQSLVCECDEKLTQLRWLLLDNPTHKSIVYFSTGACVDFYYKILSQMSDLKSRGITFYSLHGKMVQKKRDATYKNYVGTPASVLLATDVAARGLDLPDIDLVVQYDAPQDPKVFAHRAGRTARIGKCGRAVVMLNPNEDTYIDFLRIRKLPSTELDIHDENDTNNVEMTLAMMERFILADRDVYEKSIKAFVSWIRSYKAHQASFIFQLKELDIPSVARSFGLLRLPKMPELGKIEFKGNDIDPNSIKYRDTVREAHRHGEQKVVVVRKKRAVEAWSEVKDAKKRKNERIIKKDRKRLAIAANLAISGTQDKSG